MLTVEGRRQDMPLVQGSIFKPTGLSSGIASQFNHVHCLQAVPCIGSIPLLPMPTLTSNVLPSSSCQASVVRPSAAAASISARRAMVRNTSSREASPICTSLTPSCGRRGVGEGWVVEGMTGRTKLVYVVGGGKTQGCCS